MDQYQKDTLLADAARHLSATGEAIEAEISRVKTWMESEAEEVRSSDTESEEIKMIQTALIEANQDRVDELEKLLPSPYFTRCDIEFPGEGTKTHYFARFPFSEESIVSWTAPLASVRFEEPGPITYETPEDGSRSGSLLRKDNFMIVEGRIIFLSTESTDMPRQLVHQEYLSSRKNAFMLPEIVAQMEKAQDQVIRAHHAGPFAISGPAGSGKTTLALHRVAYLNQSPDTAKLYPAKGIVVFVQDAGTRDYFSHLLPELGIHDVLITTFSDWALKILNLHDDTYVARPGDSEEARDRYEYAKLQALRTQPLPQYRAGNEFSTLERFYGPYLDARQKELLRLQRQSREFDRFDLTILTGALSRRETGFASMRNISVRLKDGRMKLQPTKFYLEYSLMVIDEFQNYLPEQLQILNLCMRKKQRSVLYVGDLAQQTRFGTIGSWEDIGETVEIDRKVTLQKVYRNTRQILEYIQSLGYEAQAPAGLKEGPPVREIIAATKQEEISHIRSLSQEAGSVGVLAKDPGYLAEFKEAFADTPHVRCMGIREAQGVEFDAVCLVGVSKNDFALTESEAADTAYASQKKRIDKDLLYVALTRAIAELHVLGWEQLASAP